jgi:hypothetical protein
MLFDAQHESILGSCLAAAIKLHVNVEGGFGPTWELQHTEAVFSLSLSLNLPLLIFVFVLFLTGFSRELHFVVVLFYISLQPPPPPPCTFGSNNE